ncbi:hypothetical protein O1L60_31035 [Streptomyces diastatochromogenes]|nr:hypothetical protein [Streptomyces diastatochromogenes]
MATARKPAGDLTGRQAEKLAAERDAEAKERAKSMATATVVAEAEKSNTVVDLVAKPTPEVEVEEQPVVVEEAPREIRVNTNLTDIVIGQGNYMTFEVGVPYRVPAHVANHLEEKGLIWH